MISDFYVNGYTRLLRSILVLLFSWCRPTASRRMEKCAQFLLRPTIFLGNLDIIYANPLFCSFFQLCAVSASDFLGALDVEEFFVVEGSGVAGSPGV